MRETVQKELKKLTNEVITSLTGYPFILESLSVAKVYENGITGQIPEDPYAEIQQQNQELLRTLEELRQR